MDYDRAEVVANIESLFLCESLDLSRGSPREGLYGFQQTGGGPPSSTVVDAVYPMSRAKEPCDFCRRMGLDCFVATRGVMQNGCTCCISLYKECSFTHAQAPGKFLDTLHTVSENVDIPVGGLTGRRVLKSLGGADDLETQRKSSARFPREAVRILKGWLLDHIQNPYPTEQEKDELKQRTGLKRSQISNWLANARRRGKARSVGSGGAAAPPRSCSPARGAVDIPRPDNVDMSLMTPLERWKHSPPENEAASTTDIMRALAATPLDSDTQRPAHHAGHVRSLSRKTGSSNDSSLANSNILHPPSVSSLETSRSSHSDLSFASLFSHRSLNSMDRKDRRRRRKAVTPVNTFNQQKARSARIFQCTFCTDSFPAKYDWQRHEKSLHLALEKWICSPQGGAVLVDGTSTCVFCKAPSPDEDHLESHNFSACQEKEVHERTFFRKDHLNQHLRLMHNAKFEPSMEGWRSSTTEIRSRCGFCGASFMAWKDRVDHIAAHFKNGASMAQWQGDWGFDPFIQAAVENAIPPYLIGQERMTLNPWTTANRAQMPASPSNDYQPSLSVPQDANCYSRLQRELVVYIREQVAAGIIPTDQMLQDQARKTIYGCVDPWNQTCADNPVWLSVLKRDTGLETVPDSEHIQFSNLGMQPPFALDGGLRQPPVETNPLARSVCAQALHSPRRCPDSGFHTPAYRSSAGPSMPGSLSGSYVGSTGVVSAGPAATTPGLSTDLANSLSAGLSSSSAPVSDPLVQMGFDPEFLRRLSESYGDLDPEDDDLHGLSFDDLVVADSAPVHSTESVLRRAALADAQATSVPNVFSGPRQEHPGFERNS